MYRGKFKPLLFLSILTLLNSSCNPMSHPSSYLPWFWPELARNREIAYAIMANPDTLYNFSKSGYTCFIGMDKNGNERKSNRIENFLKPFFKGDNRIIVDQYLEYDDGNIYHNIQFKNKKSGKKVKFDFTQDTITKKWRIYWISAMNVGDPPDYEVEYSIEDFQR